MMICVCCGRDIDAIGQDNCSCVSGAPLCEDCAKIQNCRQPQSYADYLREEYDREMREDAFGE